MSTLNGSGLDGKNVLIDPTGLQNVTAADVQGAVAELDSVALSRTDRTVLHESQLTTFGIKPAALFAFDPTSVSTVPNDGDFIVIANDFATETYTFRAAAAAPFEVQIGSNSRNTTENIAATINADSVRWTAEYTDDMPKYQTFSATRGHVCIVISNSTNHFNDRIYGTFTTSMQPRLATFSADDANYSSGNPGGLPGPDPVTGQDFGYAIDGLTTLNGDLRSIIVNGPKLFVWKAWTPTNSSRWLQAGGGGALVEYTYVGPGATSQSFAFEEDAALVSVDLTAAFTLNIFPPKAASYRGKMLVVRRSDTDATSTLNFNPYLSELVDGLTSVPVPEDSTSIFISDGTQWFSVSSGGGGADLAATLVLGNITGGTDIALVQGDAIVGYNDPGATPGTRGSHILLEFGVGTTALDGAMYLRDSPGTLPTTGPRGENAVDFQSQRGVFGISSDRFASGRRSAIPGGYANEASGDESFASGFFSRATGASSVAMNSGGLAAGFASFTANYANYNYGLYAAAFGAFNTLNAPPSGLYSYGFISGQGGFLDSQYGHVAGGSGNQLKHHADYDVNFLTGMGGHIEGMFNRAYGDYSHTEGFNGRNYGVAAHLQGWGNLLNRPDAMDGWTDILQASWDTYRAAKERPYALAGVRTSQAAHVKGMFNTGLPPGSSVGGRGGLTTIPGSSVWSTGRPTTVTSRYEDQGVGTNQSSHLVLAGETFGFTTALLFTWDTVDRAYWVIRQNTAQKFRIEVSAVADTTLATGIVECASWEFSGLVRRNVHTQAGVADGGTGNFTVVGVPIAGDTVTVNGPLGGAVVLTAVAGPRTPGGGDFSISSGTTTGIATDLRLALDDIRNGIRWLHLSQINQASATLNLDAYPLGVNGNSVTLASSNLAAITISGAALTGGVDSTTVMVGLSSSGLTAPLYADAGAITWRCEVKVDATKQSVDVEFRGEGGKRINCTATITTAEAGRNPK